MVVLGLKTHFNFEVCIPASVEAAGYDLAYFTHQTKLFHTQGNFLIQPFRKDPEGIDGKQYIVSFDVNAGEGGLGLTMELRTHANRTITPEEVLHLIFHIPYEYVLDCRIVRIACK